MWDDMICCVRSYFPSVLVLMFLFGVSERDTPMFNIGNIPMR